MLIISHLAAFCGGGVNFPVEMVFLQINVYFCSRNRKKFVYLYEIA